MEPTEEENANDLSEQIAQQQYQQPYEEPAHSANDEQSTRSFFALISFLLSALFLAAFINRTLDNITGLLVLFGCIMFGILGFLLLDKKRIFGSPEHPAPVIQPSDDALYSSTYDEQLLDQEDALHAENDDTEDQDDVEDQDLSVFKRLVEEALSTIPPEFHPRMENLAILVESEPSPETLQRVGTQEGYTLLGLYQGVPLTAQAYARPSLPETVTIYQRTIERYCNYDPDRIREQVRSTVLHELAHHFGIDHSEMPLWIR